MAIFGGHALAKIAKMRSILAILGLILAMEVQQSLDKNGHFAWEVLQKRPLVKYARLLFGHSKRTSVEDGKDDVKLAKMRLIFENLAKPLGFYRFFGGPDLG